MRLSASLFLVGIVGAWPLVVGCGSKAAGALSTGSVEGNDAQAASSGGDDEPANGNADASAFFGSGDGGAGLPALGDDGGYCDLGSAGNLGNAADPNLYGEIVYYADGGTLPPGRYRATYVGGCMKYDFIYGWQVQGQPPGTNADGFYLVGATSDERLLMLPGTTEQYADFGACVTANLATTPEEFEFDGGTIGVWSSDFPYQDNVEGPDGGNPSWSLRLLAQCPPYLAPK